MKVPLQGISIGKLSDGYVGKAIDEALLQVANDLDSRGADGKPRKIVIELTLTQERQKDHVEIDTKVKTTLPPFRPPTTKARLYPQSGTLKFSPDARENPDQMTTNDIDLDDKAK